MSGTSYTPNELLIDERKKRSWTKAELAEKIGASSDSVAHWERGETFPSPSNLMLLLGDYMGSYIWQCASCSKGIATPSFRICKQYRKYHNGRWSNNRCSS